MVDRSLGNGIAAKKLSHGAPHSLRALFLKASRTARQTLMSVQSRTASPVSILPFQHVAVVAVNGGNCTLWGLTGPDEPCMLEPGGSLLRAWDSARLQKERGTPSVDAPLADLYTVPPEESLIKVRTLEYATSDG